MSRLCPWRSAITKHQSLSNLHRPARFGRHSLSWILQSAILGLCVSHQDLYAEVPGVSDFTLLYPLQYYSTKSKAGSASSYTLVGLGIDFTFFVEPSVALFGQYEFNLNSVTSSRIFSGGVLGGKYFLLGHSGGNSKESSFTFESESITRAFVALGVGQRSFDFRSLYDPTGDRIQLGKLPPLEGDFWVPWGSFGMDYLTKGGYRPGLSVSFFRANASTANGFSVFSAELCLTMGLRKFVSQTR